MSSIFPQKNRDPSGRNGTLLFSLPPDSRQSHMPAAYRRRRFSVLVLYDFIFIVIPVKRTGILRGQEAAVFILIHVRIAEKIIIFFIVHIVSARLAHISAHQAFPPRL
jgi:hypothetical protein